jgi:hypothetical protein
MDRLPESAKSYHSGKVMKAKQGDLQELFSMAWNHESMEGDTSEKRRLVRFAEAHQLAHLLPEEAHGMMHDMHVPHNHDGVENDTEGYHSHEVVKAGFTGEIFKSWFPADGADAHFEGWLATPMKDRERDVTEPEAFITPAASYFSRRAPLSVKHGTDYLPVGHLQKAAMVRDGKIIQSFSHPTDPAEFEHFPGSGTGVWVRGVVNEEPGVSAIRKGNVGGMSYIAQASHKEKLPGGRYRYTNFDIWVESTIAAYPINPEAVIAVVKARGFISQE